MLANKFEGIVWGLIASSTIALLYYEILDVRSPIFGERLMRTFIISIEPNFRVKLVTFICLLAAPVAMATAPATPSKPNLSKSASNGILLRWPQVPGATKYLIRTSKRRADGSYTIDSETEMPQASICGINPQYPQRCEPFKGGLTIYTRYRFTVFARNDQNESSAESDFLEAVTIDPPGNLSVGASSSSGPSFSLDPDGISASETDAAPVKLIWSGDTNSNVSYSVGHRIDNGFYQYASELSSSTLAVDTGKFSVTADVLDNHTHYFLIRKKFDNHAGVTAFSYSTPVQVNAFSAELLDWKDRRAIGRIFVGDPQPQSRTATNPDGYIGDPSLPTWDDNSLYSKMQERAEMALKISRRMGRMDNNNVYEGAQGVIVWDLEGYRAGAPGGLTYLGAPHLLAGYAQLAMVDAARNFFKILTDAHLKVGVTLRPQPLQQKADGSWINTGGNAYFYQDENIVDELYKRIKFAKDTWGASLFYVDSNQFWHNRPNFTPDQDHGAEPDYGDYNDVPILATDNTLQRIPAYMLYQLRQKFHADYPHDDILLIPEHATRDGWAFNANYAQVGGGNYFDGKITPAQQQSAHHGFSVAVFNTDATLSDQRNLNYCHYWNQILDAVRPRDGLKGGDVPFFDASWDSPLTLLTARILLASTKPGLRPLPPICVGDLNGDGYVNQADIDVLQAHLQGRALLTGINLVYADLNGDGFVNPRDLLLLTASAKTPANPNPVITLPILEGDANGDGKLDGLDSVLIGRFAASLQEPTPSQKVLADMNGDGTLSGLDAVLAARFAAGLNNQSLNMRP